MKSVLPVKMLAALALVLLVSSATEGRILSKCELKAQLDAARFQQITAMGEKITVDNLIARLVCKANSSAFNTSSVKAITVNNKENKTAQAPAQAPPQAKSGSPPKPQTQAPHNPQTKAPPQAPRNPHTQAPLQAPSKPHTQAPPKSHTQAPSKPHTQAPSKPHTQAPSKPHTQAPPKPHAQAPTEGPQGSGHETKPPHLNATAKVSGHLYGVFQLSDQLACNSGMIPSLNVCNMSCSALTDDDISNDIACLKTLMNSMEPKPQKKPTDVNNILETLMVKECHSVVPSKYFADCA